MLHDRLSVSVVKEIASRQGVPVTALRPPLYTSVDPVALENLINSLDGCGEVHFVYDGYLVTIDAERTIQIDDGKQRDGFSFDYG